MLQLHKETHWGSRCLRVAWCVSKLPVVHGAISLSYASESTGSFQKGASHVVSARELFATTPRDLWWLAFLLTHSSFFSILSLCSEPDLLSRILQLHKEASLVVLARESLVTTPLNGSWLAFSYVDLPALVQNCLKIIPEEEVLLFYLAFFSWFL